MKLTQKEINKLVLFFVDYYGHQERETYRKEQRSVIDKIRYYTKLDPFTKQDVPLIKELDPHFKRMLSLEISYQVFAFEILSIWAIDTPKELRPFLNINELKLKRGRQYYLKELIQLKKINGFKHKQIKEIMDISVIKAHEFYDFLAKYERDTTMRDSMRIKSRHISGKKYEVEGVIIDAGSMSEAVRKWSRNPKKNISTNAIN